MKGGGGRVLATVLETLVHLYTSLVSLRGIAMTNRNRDFRLRRCVGLLCVRLGFRHHEKKHQNMKINTNSNGIECKKY